MAGPHPKRCCTVQQNAYSLDPPLGYCFIVDLLFYTHERGRGQGRVVRTIGA